MASNQPSASTSASTSTSTSASTSAPSVTQEYTVRLPKPTNKKYAIMRFNIANKVDFTKCGPAKIERENNLKEYKIANDLETMPKFGAGSEFGREQKEEARRKKYGIHIKKYNPDEQPWLLKLGSAKQVRRFKGNKEGGISDNASYYIFTQCPDGAFDAHPVEEWYNFAPQIKYKYLNSEEAEDHFTRRDKTLNYFSIMLQKRLKNEDISEMDGEEGEKGKGKKKSKRKNFMLTEMDDWANFSDSDSHDSNDEEKAEDDDEDKKKKKAKNTKDAKQKSKKKKKDSDDEAEEESGDGDDEGKEVDYMTDSDSDDADMYNKETRDQTEKYEEKGVEDEDGLRKLMDSDEDEEEEQKKENEGAEDEDKETKPGKDDKQKKDESDSDSSSSSDSDSDPEKETGILSSALFMQKSEKKSGRSSASNSRSNTPTPGSADSEDKGKKRKPESESPVAKKLRTDSPPMSSYSSSSSSTEGINEDSVRRYLMRKPMTTKDLLQKFKSKKTGLTNDQLVTTVVQILKRLNPDKTTIKGIMYLSIKKTE